MTSEIVIASNNKGKLLEFSNILQTINIRAVPQSTFNVIEIEETGLSFIENAILKARSAAKQCKLPVIADDSGLVVPALDGAPGIYSARYSGISATSQSNIDLLLKNMVDCKDRQAYFYCALAYVENELDPTPLIATARFIGEITINQQGHKGFGYDPIFYLPQYNKTAAEIVPELKNNVSHRAIAIEKLLMQLQFHLKLPS